MIKRATGTPGLSSTSSPVRVAPKQDHFPENRARAAAPPLENNANNSSPPLTCADAVPEADRTRRDRRYELRRLLWDVSELQRLRGCGRGRRAPVVGVRYSPGVGAGFSGLVTCGSVWACPVCSAKILARRSLELGAGLLAWESRGGRLVMGTLTMRHHKGHRLAQQLDALQRAWTSLGASRVWRKWLGRFGSPGLVSVPEITYGANGWHAHLHFVLLIDQADDDVAEFASWLTTKWARLLEAAGMPGALDLGQDVHIVDGVQAAADLGSYLAKSTAYGAAESMGRELFGVWTKGAGGRHGTEPAWRLAEEFGETGDADLLDLWGEYERATKGRRQCRWSQGLRELLDLGQELTDEEVAEEVAGDADLLLITAAGWETAWRSTTPTSRILAALESGGVAGLRTYLLAHHIEFTEV